MPILTRKKNKSKQPSLTIKGVPRYSQVSRINGSPIIIPRPSVSVRYTKGAIKKNSKHNLNRVSSIQGWKNNSSNSNSSSSREVMGLPGKINSKNKKKKKKKSKSKNK